MSRKLLGGEHRLRLIALLGTTEAWPAYTYELAEKLDLDKGQVSKDLAHFVDLGLLAKAPRVRGDRRRGYVRVESPLWDALVRFAEDLGWRTSSQVHVLRPTSDGN